MVFVDDNSDNAVNVYTEFAAAEMAERDGAGTAAPRVCSVWYPPPGGGKEEASCPVQRQCLLALSRGDVAPAPSSSA